MSIRSFKELLSLAQVKGPKTLAVAAAEDKDVLGAIKDSMDANIIKPILVGDGYRIEEMSRGIDLDLTQVKVIDIEDKTSAARKATHLVRDGKADILMKGLIDTSTIMGQVLDREIGLRTGSLISHGAIFEVGSYHKIFIVTDAAMNIKPDLEQKERIIRNAVSLAHALGINNPKVAVLASKEKVSQKMEATIHGRELSSMNKNDKIVGCMVEGPLALDNAISREAALVKGISGDVAGDADILLVPDINSGNILYKALMFFAGARSAGIVLGAKAPIVLTSRADNAESKMYSIALGVLLAQEQREIRKDKSI